MDTLKTNVLYYGDNLDILRKYIPDESIDLIYLDPPFSSKKDYNIIFKEPSGELSQAQIKAFSDTWHWDRSAEDTFQDIIINGPPNVAKLIDAMCEGIGRNDVMAYLVMMTIRLIELRRVLKDTGSLYLHCDPTASHYLKLMLDQVFVAKNFRNEIVWRYRRWPSKQSNFQRMHDTIFRYSKTSNCIWNQLYEELSPSSIKQWRGKRRIDVVSARGTRHSEIAAEESPGVPMTDVWEISQITAPWKEYLGYPTQKPEALLERIIKASSNEGDVVLDPFCGCGTAVVAAHKLKRRWIGIDITHLAITVMKNRLQGSFGLKAGVDYEIIGEPEDFAGAGALAQQDRYQFQWWALSLVGAQPLSGERKKGADAGIDGVIYFMDDHGDKPKRAVVQVKSGHVQVKDIRELKSVVERNAMGVFITLAPPTEPMRTEAVSAGYYHSVLYDRDYPRIQILTIEELLQGKKVEMPPARVEFLPRAQRVSTTEQLPMKEA